jgi:hypothetical protein
MPGAPAASCAHGVVSMHTSIHSEVAEITRHSPRNGLRLIPRSPRRSGFLVTVACGIIFRKLDAGVEASGPHVFAVRFSAVRYRHFHVHRIPPHVRDDRETPLRRGGTAWDMPVICGAGEAEYFSGEDWTGQISLICFNKSRCARKRNHVPSDTFNGKAGQPPGALSKIWTYPGWYVGNQPSACPISKS